MSQAIRNLRMIDTGKTASLLCLIVELEESGLPEFLTLTGEINRLIGAGWEFLVVGQDRGRCYYDRKIITIPVWAMNRSEDYTVYYLAHEVAHALGNRGHDANFMRDFMSICPHYVQHFEIGYKPKAAMAAGIVAEDF